MPFAHMDQRLARRLEEKHAALAACRPLPPTTLQVLHADLQIRLTFHSNAIEGNTLSLRETQLVIEHGMTIGGHSLREHLEATNHAAAYTRLRELVDAGTPLDVGMILDLHGLVTDRILDEPGQFRQGAVSIRGSLLQLPPAREVPGLIDEWLAWLEGAGRDYPPVVRAAIAHHGFLALHPFLDGNGRTARLLLHLMLMRDGYPPALLLQEWRSGYLEALTKADQGRYNPLINLVGRAVEIGLDLYLDAYAATPDDEWVLLSELAQESAHSAEYLALLIRKGRLAGRKRGRRWYSTRIALARYQAEVDSGLVPTGRPAAQP
jgi:Fic family protein